MKPVHFLIIGVVIFITCLLATIMAREAFDTRNNKKQVLYYRINDRLNSTLPSIELMQAMKDVSQEFSLQKTDAFYETNFILFETLNMIDINIKGIKYPTDLIYIYGVCGTDLMASKSALACTLGDRYSDLIPKTYVVEKGNPRQDYTSLLDDYTNRFVYIIKKNIQRQEGNMLTNNFADLKKLPEDAVVVQVVLPNPYLVNKRKINLRIYLLVMVSPSSECSMYMYNDGFIYYTPNPFKELSTNPGDVITTGYIDRQVYVENPLTIRDLMVYMQRESHNFKQLFDNIVNLMKKVAEVYKPCFERENKGIPGIKFLVYGCDIAPDKNLGVKLMEINKGPDLDYKDERDKAIKYEMMREAFMIAGFSSRSSNNFIKIT